MFVEKLLALNREELEEIRFAYQEERENNHTPFLMVGFNRRFAPFTEKLKQFFAGRQNRWSCTSRKWRISSPRTLGSAKNGGRIIGELCHFVDWARHIIGASIVSITPHALPDGARYNRDNVVATLAFVAAMTLLYALFAKMVPIISVWELKVGEHAKPLAVSPARRDDVALWRTQP